MPGRPESHAGIRSDGVPPRFAEQKEKVVQILKNRNDILASTTRDPENPGTKKTDPDHPEPVPFDSSHPWELNAEVMRRWSSHPAAESFRIVERELEEIRRLVPFVYSEIYDLFLHEGAGDGDYDHLRRQAKTSDGPGRKRAEKRLAAVETALYMLVMRLMDEDLYAVFPSRYLPGKRGETMEENYRGIHRIFVQECRQHAKTMKRYRKRAYETTADICECSVPTVKRAVHFVESVEGETAA